MDGIIQDDAEAAASPQLGIYTKPGHYKYRDLNDDDIIDPDDDMTYIGSPHPDLIGGLNIDLGYGSFDLNMFFFWKLWELYGQFLATIYRLWSF